MRKKRQCVLCDDGKVMTDLPKDKAVCHACAIEMIDGECRHLNSCDCTCHEPGSTTMHFMPCCYPVRCPHCNKSMDDKMITNHIEHCHKTLRELQA